MVKLATATTTPSDRSTTSAWIGKSATAAYVAKMDQAKTGRECRPAKASQRNTGDSALAQSMSRASTKSTSANAAKLSSLNGPSAYELNASPNRSRRGLRGPPAACGG